MSKLTIDECKQIISKGRKQLTAAEERIAELESLVSDMWHEMATCPDYPTPPCMTRNICDRIRELGIEVSA